jgi:hypothetical protein
MAASGVMQIPTNQSIYLLHTATCHLPISNATRTYTRHPHFTLPLSQYQQHSINSSSGDPP